MLIFWVGLAPSSDAPCQNKEAFKELRRAPSERPYAEYFWSGLLEAGPLGRPNCLIICCTNAPLVHYKGGRSLRIRMIKESRFVEIQKVPKKIVPKNWAFLMKHRTYKNIVFNFFLSWTFEKMAFKVNR